MSKRNAHARKAPTVRFARGDEHKVDGHGIMWYLGKAVQFALQAAICILGGGILLTMACNIAVMVAREFVMQGYINSANGVLLEAAVAGGATSGIFVLAKAAFGSLTKFVHLIYVATLGRVNPQSKVECSDDKREVDA